MSAKGSVLRGAFILSAAGIICKFLGAAYRIPLVRLIGDEGIGLYQMAYPIYLLFMALSTAGMPLAVSRVVAERLALGDYQGGRRVFKLSMALLGLLGLGGGAIMAAGARFFADRVVADPRVYPVILALAPAVPLMAFMAAWRGYFQGCREMAPSALSQLIEQVVRVASLLILAVLLLPKGVDHAAAGAAFGAAIGGAAGLALLFWWYFTHPRQIINSNGQSPGYHQLAGRLLKLSFPIALGALLLPLMQSVDSILVPAGLQSVGFTVGQATAALGRLGNAWAVIYFPTTFTAAIAVSLVPAVTDSWIRRERGTINTQVGQAVWGSMLICLPAAAGLWLLAPEICHVLYGSTTVASSLRVMAPAVLTMGMQSVCAGALQGLGRTVTPILHFALGFLIKTFLTGILCHLPYFGIQGAGIGTIIGSALAAGLNLRSLHRLVPLNGRVIRDIGRQGAAAAVMLLVLAAAGRIPPCLGQSLFIRLILLLPLGVIVFFSALWLLGGVRPQDVEVLRRMATNRTKSGG